MPAPNPDVTFVHMTDLHLAAPGAEDEFEVNDTAATLRRTLAAIARMSPPPAFVVASGDLTHHGHPDAYRRLATMLAEEGPDVPVILALGNHDRREGFAEVFPHLHPDPSKPCDHDLLVAGIHVIVLDSAVEGGIQGDWEDGQVDWLKARLAAHPEAPKLLVIHHPPMIDRNSARFTWKSLTREATEALREAIAGRNVLAILSGHIHLDRVHVWHGVPVVIGAGHHAAGDPVGSADGMLRMVDATGFAICESRPSGLGVTFVAHPQTREVVREIGLDRLAAYIVDPAE
ncbi:metallophosphoesterase [Albimonas pacifica]|uniref:Calcineurin-like phosphoesterase n=1 Tax=Albimonas pacifica TaxID=1114924 RepID=A0A1I3J2Y6_9RHOB|nr:metallophosphoesterase [Albimonas pacifica]SFI54415.1 Calcineurin-like phosphoesterase [Albimonas pacifica]